MRRWPTAGRRPWQRDETDAARGRRYPPLIRILGTQYLFHIPIHSRIVLEISIVSPEFTKFTTDVLKDKEVACVMRASLVILLIVLAGLLAGVCYMVLAR